MASPSHQTAQQSRAAALRQALATRVVVGDGAMGTMLQAQDPSLDDFQGLEGCNEVLNATRPDIVRSVHEEYFAVGVDCVETNTFGANLAALGEYDIADRIYELSESGARIAREVADGFATPDRPRWVLGSVGPGTKLPTLGHAPYHALRDAYETEVAGLIAGGVDAVLVETTQDLLQTKAALIGARRALKSAGLDLPVLCQVTVETTGTMLLGSEIGAALTALEPLGIDMIGLNCATGPAEMSEHLRFLARHARVGVSAMPNAGLPVLGKDGAHYPLIAERTRRRAGGVRPRVRPVAGRRLLRHHAGAPAPGRRPGPRPGDRRAPAAPRAGRRVALPVGPVPAGHLLPGDRRADQRQRQQEVPRGDARRPLGRLRGNGPRADPRGRPPARPVRRLRRPGRRRRHARGRRPAGHRLHAADRAGLHRTGRAAGRVGAAGRPRGHQLGQLRGRRRAGVAVPEGHQARRRARRRADRAHHRRGGPGPHPRAQGRGRRAPDRRPDRQLGRPGERHRGGLPDVHHRHRPGGVPQGRPRHHRGDPRAQAAPPGRADHPRPVQRLLRPQPGRPHGAQLGLPQRVRGGRPRLRDRARRQDPADRPDPRGAARGRPRPGLRPPARGVRPAAALPGAVRRRGHQVRQGGPRRGAGRAAAGRAAAAPHHRRRAQRPGGRPRRGADQHAGPGDRQRHAAGRHEGGRRAVRLRPDAAAVRAAVRRGDEDRGRPPRTAHGEVRRRGQGHHRAGHRPRRRARHRQEPGRHHLVQQRLQRGQPRHQAAGLRDPGRRPGAPGRRDRHVRPAGEVDRDHEGEPAGAQPARHGRRLPGHPRRRRAHPGLRRAGSARDLRGRGPLRPRRVRGPAADGRAGRRQARGARRQRCRS